MLELPQTNKATLLYFSEVACKKKNQKTGDLQDGGRVRRANHLPPHK